MTAPWTCPDIDNLIKRYKSGESIKQLAASYGISREPVRRTLAAHGVYIRGRSAAMYTRMSATTADERTRLATAAHDAVRGMHRTTADLERRALGKQRTLAHATKQELALGRELKARGLAVTPQQAVGKYNVDLGVGNAVAVEVFGGNWHKDGRHFARLPQRLKDLADRGFNTLMIWSTSEWPLVMAPVADEVIAFAKRTRSDPSFRRQYRMIWGDGKLATLGCVDDDELALVPSRVRCTDSSR